MPELVGIVRLGVVLESVDDGVVIHVQPEKEFRRIDLKAQKRLGVVWLAVEVAVEIRDVVVVLVDAGENRIVGQEPPALPGVDAGTEIAPAPIRQLVLVVVVIDELEDVALLAVVVAVGLRLRSGHGFSRWQRRYLLWRLHA